ncbi:isotrichodermin C-15 hydroxylase [Sodiomyces alkalinus F11]|uniref:Isotrichodermin C-15 hydroxylase n=1 Tax=Sodiomyces alkalinus (strain CBS 110278 / VKM F-3762 / F11) TaxID=1314773 RepID=A0A3N2PXC1_SODAK|nr:isotrichodermin C-15 hydroxylase [Sodiomyces alkalinus F11]ROT38995.1 isotrichodermin C-15 hydroxylase [Sodiomyces alkalinus F11]
MAREKTISLLAAAVGLYILYRLLRIIYNLFYHPLRSFPGPPLYRASRLPIALAQVDGKRSFRIQSLHDQYGPVVRIAPNHLSFTDPQAFRDVYGTRKKASSLPKAPASSLASARSIPELPKADEFYRVDKSFPRNIVSEELTQHRALRHALAPSFSEKAIRAQEGLITGYVDKLISRMRAACAEAEAETETEGAPHDGGKAVLDMKEHYNWSTFDVIGDLVFGEPFGCLEMGKTHDWVRAISSFIREETRLRALVYLGHESLAEMLFRMAVFSAQSRRIRRYTCEKLDERLAAVDRNEERRADLFGEMLKKRDALDLEYGHLMSNSMVLVLAGSETTATLLAGATYLLTTHPAVLERATREVRERFSSADEINFTSVSQLKYMLAVLSETFRCYPPVLSGLVRKVPKAGQMIAGHFVPEGTLVEVAQWAANHDAQNWADPWVFNPDRFMDGEAEAMAKGNRFDALQPFNVGPRNCIGKKYNHWSLAYAEMRLIMARVLFEFDLELHGESQNWIERQKEYIIWNKLPLKIGLKRAVNYGQGRGPRRCEAVRL